MKIERTLFWFKDGDEVLVSLNERFFGLGTLLNRLMNEVYTGKKIEFINIDFASERTYHMYPQLPKNTAYYYGGHLRYYGVIEFEDFNKLTELEQNHFVWKNACEYLINAAMSLKKIHLLKAIEFARTKGLDIGLNPDYRMVEADVNFYGKNLKASVWVNFKKDGMYSRFVLEKDGIVVFERGLDRAKNGVEFFLEMYTSITATENEIVINGSKDVDYLPLRISLKKELIIG